MLSPVPRVPRAWPLAAVLALLPAPASRAGDGALPINATCALATGCFTGDTPGYPVTISAPGSYVLTSGLTSTNVNVSAVVVSTSDVTIDLNGFEINGPVLCQGEGTTLVCSASGSGVGIAGVFRPRITVKNGRVRGFGGAGVLLGGRAQIHRLVSEGNDGPGIELDLRSRVSESQAHGNAGDGIVAGAASVVEGSTASANLLDGIRVGLGSSIVAVSATRNGEDGVDCGQGCVVRDTASYQNGGDGIELGAGALVSDTAVSFNTGSGIVAGDDASVQRNVVHANGPFGLDLAIDAAFRENTITSNADTVDDGLDLGANSCDGMTSCPP